MPKDISALSPEEVALVRQTLQGLIHQMNSRKALGGTSGLIPDEDIVLQALQHPERGDVLIIVLHDPRGKLDIFVSNRRDPDNPFAVMNREALRDYPGRRPLYHGHATLKDGEHALFLITMQDREQLHLNRDARVEVFSAHFKVHNETQFAPKEADDLKIKPLSQCSLDEKWQIYKKQWPMDERVSFIEKELMSVSLTYARYNGPEKTEVMVLPPVKYRERIGQMIRDAYPGGVRISLRRDYPKEHKERMAKVHTYLRELADGMKNKIAKENPDGLNKHYEEITEFVEDVIENDPDLTHFA